MEAVELKDFIRDTLVQIASGISEANVVLKNPEQNRYDSFVLRHNRGDSSKIQGISFDIAVTASKSQTDKAGFKVALVSIGGGAGFEKGAVAEAVHRIRFEVGIYDDLS